MLNFESEEQRKDFGALAIWLRQHRVSDNAIRYVDVYLMQKMRDVSEWIIESNATQITLLQNELKSTLDIVEELKNEIELLKAAQNERNSLDALAPEI